MASGNNFISCIGESGFNATSTGSANGFLCHILFCPSPAECIANKCSWQIYVCLWSSCYYTPLLRCLVHIAPVSQSLSYVSSWSKLLYSIETISFQSILNLEFLGSMYSLWSRFIGLLVTCKSNHLVELKEECSVRKKCITHCALDNKQDNTMFSLWRKSVL